MFRFGFRRALTLGLGAMLGVSGLTAISAQDTSTDKPVVTIGIAPFSKLMPDLSYVMRAAGAGAYSGIASTVIETYTGGLDKNRPSGVLVYFEDDQPITLAFLPVEDREAFFEPLKNFGAIDDLGDGIYAMSIGPQSVYASQVGNWLFIAQQEEHFAHVVKDPTAVLGNLATRYDLSMRLNVSAIPDTLREMAIANMKSAMEAAQMQASEESEEEKKISMEANKASMEAMERMMTETDQVIVGWGVDQTGKKTFVDSGLLFVEGSSFDKQYTDMQKMSSQFMGFEKSEADVNSRLTMSVSPKDADLVNGIAKTALNEMINGMAKANKGKDGGFEFLKKFVESQSDQLYATLKEGVIDGGMMMRTESGWQMTGAIRVANGNTVGKSLQELVGGMTSPSAPKIQFNAYKHQNVTMHPGSIPLPPDAPEDVKAVFGQAIPVVFGTADKAVYFGLGKDCEQAVKQFIDSNATVKTSEPFTPVYMHVDLIPLMRFSLQTKHDAVTEIMLNKLQENAASDSMSVTSQSVPHGQVFRLTIEEGILKAIGATVQAGGGAGPGF